MACLLSSFKTDFRAFDMNSPQAWECYPSFGRRASPATTESVTSVSLSTLSSQGECAERVGKLYANMLTVLKHVAGHGDTRGFGHGESTQNNLCQLRQVHARSPQHE
jgi:hypothetical protein